MPTLGTLWVSVDLRINITYFPHSWSMESIMHMARLIVEEEKGMTRKRKEVNICDHLG